MLTSNTALVWSTTNFNRMATSSGAHGTGWHRLVSCLSPQVLFKAFYPNTSISKTISRTFLNKLNKKYKHCSNTACAVSGVYSLFCHCPSFTSVLLLSNSSGQNTPKRIHLKTNNGKTQTLCKRVCVLTQIIKNQNLSGPHS